MFETTNLLNNEKNISALIHSARQFTGR